MYQIIGSTYPEGLTKNTVKIICFTFVLTHIQQITKEWNYSYPEYVSINNPLPYNNNLIFYRILLLLTISFKPFIFNLVSTANLAAFIPHQLIYSPIKGKSMWYRLVDYFSYVARRNNIFESRKKKRN